MFRHHPDQRLAYIPIVIGDVSINKQVCQYVGADYWIVNSMDGVRLCQRLLSDKGTNKPATPLF